MPDRFDEVLAALVREQLDTGLPFDEVAAQLGITPKDLHRRVGEILNLTPPTPPPPPRRWGPDSTPDEIDQRLATLAAERVERRRARGLPKPPKVPRPRQPYFSDDFIADLVAAYVAGASALELSQKHSIRYPTVWKILNRAGVLRHDTGRHRLDR